MNPAISTIAFSVKAGPVTVKGYRCADGRYFHCGIGKRGKKRGLLLKTRTANLAAAKQSAREAAVKMANGRAFEASMTAADRQELAICHEKLLGTGVSPFAACDLTGRALGKLRCAGLPPSTAELERILDAFLENQSRTRIVDILCPALVDEYLAARRAGAFGKRRAGERWLRTLENQLKFFADYFKCPIASLTAADISRWLDSRNVGGKTRRGYRLAAGLVLDFAKARNYLPRDRHLLADVPVPIAAKPRKSILQPGQLADLLSIAHERRPRMLPFIALAAFAGLRHEEIKPPLTDKDPLRWGDIDFAASTIHVREETSKTGEERFITMPENLAKWLLPHARAGADPVCSIVHTAEALCDLKRRAGIPAGKNETRNTLRKSWASYRDALKPEGADDSANAGEAGHSQEIRRKNYVRRMHASDAAAWFAIEPAQLQGLLQFPIPTRAAIA